MNLTLTRLITLACMGSAVWALPIQAFAVASPAATVAQGSTQTEAGGIAEDLIRDKARLIAVRVFKVNQEEWDNSGLILDGSGSGILIDRQDIKKDPQALYVYLVLTNNHVVKESKDKKAKECEFDIQTHDGLIHKACHHPTAKFKGNDLALLYFYSPYRYEKAVTSKTSSLNNGDKVFVAGFPCDLGATSVPCPADFRFLPGKVANLLDKPLVEGYQIGYTNKVIEGTSGGPVLNSKGEVVGINGRREGGTDSAYIYADNFKPSPAEIEEMRQLRWGIPIDIYLNLDTQSLFREIPKATEEFKQIRYTEKKSNPKKSEPSLPTPKNTDGLSLQEEEKIRFWVALISSAIAIIGTSYVLLLLKDNSKRLLEKNINKFLPQSAPKQKSSEIPNSSSHSSAPARLARFRQLPGLRLQRPSRQKIATVTIDSSGSYATFIFSDTSTVAVRANELRWSLHPIKEMAIVIDRKIIKNGQRETKEIYPKVVLPLKLKNYLLRKENNSWLLYKTSEKAFPLVIIIVELTELVPG